MKIGFIGTGILGRFIPIPLSGQDIFVCCGTVSSDVTTGACEASDRAADYAASIRSCCAAASFRSFPNPRWPSFFSMPFPSLFGLHRRHPARDCLERLRLWFMSPFVFPPRNVRSAVHNEGARSYARPLERVVRSRSLTSLISTR